MVRPRPARYDELRRRYEAELKAEPAHSALSRLRELAAAGPVTLVFAARDAGHSDAAVLRDLLLQGRASSSPRIL